MLHKALLGLLLLFCWPIQAQTLWVGLGTHKPPYVYEGQQQGLEYEVIAAALQAVGLELQVRHYPQERLPWALEQGLVEAVGNGYYGSATAGFYSQPYVTYQNVAIALASKDYVIEQVADLANYSISSYQKARHHLGPEFALMAASNPYYREEAQQINRNRKLYSGRVDVVIGDRRILHAFNQEVAEQVDTAQPLREYLLFTPSTYRMAFRSDQMRERFDQGLKLIQANGRYREIESRYLPSR